MHSIDGYAVLDAGNSPIALDPLGGPATIAQDGMITQGGRQIGEKLSRSASVARQLNFVFTKISRPEASIATS